MSEVLSRFTATFGPDALAEIVLRWIPGFAAAVLSVVVFWLLWVGARNLLDAVFKRVQLDPTAAVLVKTVTRFALGLVGLLTALGQLGVNTTSILASLGVMGLTLGFAAQDTLSNIISGLFIFWDRPFVLGDRVEVDGEYGRIDAITLRSTRLVTPDGRMFAIPNKVIANAKVASYTNFPHLRLDVELTIGVNEDLGRVRRLLLGIVEGDERFMTDPSPVVVVTAINDYNLAIQLRVWIYDELQHIALRFWLRESMFETLRTQGVDMPNETLRIVAS